MRELRNNTSGVPWFTVRRRSETRSPEIQLSWRDRRGRLGSTTRSLSCRSISEAVDELTREWYAVLRWRLPYSNQQIVHTLVRRNKILRDAK